MCLLVLATIIGALWFFDSYGIIHSSEYKAYFPDEPNLVASVYNERANEYLVVVTNKTNLHRLAYHFLSSEKALFLASFSTYKPFLRFAIVSYLTLNDSCGIGLISSDVKLLEDGAISVTAKKFEYEEDPNWDKEHILFKNMILSK